MKASEIISQLQDIMDEHACDPDVSFYVPHDEHGSERTFVVNYMKYEDKGCLTPKIVMYK